MSRKIQEFFKAIPLEKTLEFIKDEKINQEKFKSDPKNFQVGKMVLDEKIINTNAELSKKQKKLSQKCKICKKQLLVKYLSGHMKNIHPKQLKGLLECQICHKKFITKKALEQHMKVKHFDGKIQLFECDFCGRSSKTKGNMKNHMKVHLPTVNCDLCQAELKQSSIKVHMNEMHGEEKKFQCKMCPKTFRTKNKLCSHVKIHNKKFQCTACMKTFPLKCKLQKHQKEVHENPGSYSCEVCGKKFNEKKILRDHEKVHDRNRPKPFKCNRCDYATDSNKDYMKHLKFHERKDEKFAAMKNPLKCPKCPNLCKDKDALRNHLKYVHPVEPFQCDLCGRYIKTMYNLKTHINVYHQQKIKFVNH